jgi:hypothetical protein
MKDLKPWMLLVEGRGELIAIDTIYDTYFKASVGLDATGYRDPKAAQDACGGLGTV